MGLLQKIKDLFRVNTYEEIVRIENNIRTLNGLPKQLRINRVFTMEDLNSKYVNISRNFNTWETLNITNDHRSQTLLLNHLNSVERLYVYPTRRCLYCVTATNKGRIRIQFDWDGDFFSYGIENSGYRYDINYIHQAIPLIKDWVNRVIREIEPQFNDDLL